MRAQVALKFGREPVIRRHPVDIADATVHQGHLGLTQPRGGFDQRIEHRLQVEGRAADDLQHIADRGLVFERLLQVLGALTQFAQQPRVLDRNDRLVGKGPDELDLFFAERLDPVAREHDDADRLTLAQ